MEVRLDAIYMYEEVVPGSGGLPVGTGGKTLLMLSGGIDSPVAGMEVMRRGVQLKRFISIVHHLQVIKQKKKLLN